MGQLLVEPTLADVTFKVGGEEVLAHRALLAGRSDYFRTMLSSGFREGGAGAKVDVEDTTAAAFRAVLRYLYTEAVDLEGAEPRHVVEIMRLAHRYEIAELHDRCLRHGRRSVLGDVGHCVDWLLAADAHSIQDLRAPALAAVATHLYTQKLKAEAPQTVQALAEQPRLMAEVLLFQRR